MSKNGSQKKGSPGGSKPKEITFDYIKSEGHRVLFVSGAHGGPTPDTKLIAMSVYNERQPIPQKEVYALDDKGATATMKARVTRATNVVREVETTLLFDVPTAKAIQIWLNDQVTKIESLRITRKSK